MAQITVSKTADAGLCTSCGVCKGICPKDCIAWKQKNGLYLPQIDTDKCVNCGLCAQVCPGLGHAYEPEKDPVAAVTGSVLFSCNAWSRDAHQRHVSASGGVVSAMVTSLLSQKKYDSVFCLDTYDYREQLSTGRYTVDTYLSQSTTPKSRYLPVSHEHAIRYMKENRNERIILIATSCALRGIVAAIHKLNLPRENYLLIGLFCDKVFNYNVISYFQDQFCQSQPLTALHFKNKESGGWPGDMKLFPAGNDSLYIPLRERCKVKEYFMPERCLYCVDKLNICADISTGDNYTGINTSELGSNSVIIRTTQGQNAWNAVQDRLEAYPVPIEAIQNAQYLEGRLNNLYFGDLRSAQLEHVHDINRGVPRTQNRGAFLRTWKLHLRKLRTGQIYDHAPEKLHRQMQRDNQKPNPVISFCKRGYYFLRRKFN